MTVIGPDRTGKLLYPKGAYYVSHDRVNAVGEVVNGWTGTARFVTKDINQAKEYIKKFGDVSLQKKQIEKGNKGWDAWPSTYDITGEFVGNRKGYKVIKIKDMDSIKY